MVWIFRLSPLLLVLLLPLGCQRQTEAPQGPLGSEALAAFAPLPAVMESGHNKLTAEKIELGRMLFFEKRLSRSHEFSCNSCHNLSAYGVDNQPFSTGHRQQKGGRNAPTVYNAAGHIAQFWDGRAVDVEEQAKGPILNPVEMAMPDEQYVVATLKSIPGYVDAFARAFPDEDDPVTYDNMAKAIAAFERKLVTPSQWDRFLQGNSDALSAEEKMGFATFAETGCASCHAGPYVGGQSYQKLGVIKPWPGNTDLGRFNVTKKELDKYVFKIPSLRNVEKTGPYLHDSSIDDLETVVRMMAEYQLGKDLADDQVRSIVTFLKALTGAIPEEYVREPALPASGPTTPSPDAD